MVTIASDGGGAEPPAAANSPVDPVFDQRLLSRPPRHPVPHLDRQHRYLLRIADVAALAISAVTAGMVLQSVSPVRAGALGPRDMALCGVAMAVSLQLHRLYLRPPTRLRPSAWWTPWTVARCAPTGALLALAADALFFGGGMTLTAAVAMVLPSVVLIPIGRRLIVRVFGEPATSRILVLGTGEVADRLARRIERCPDMRLVGFADDAPRPGFPVLGGLVDVPAICDRHAVDRVIVAFSRAPDDRTMATLRRLGGRVPVSIVPRFFELQSWRSEVEELQGIPLVHVPSASLDLRSRVEKRMLDLTVAVGAMVVLAPLWALIAIAIKLDSPGPVYFRQERAGLGGRPFRIFKFRTMTADAWQRRFSMAEHNEVDGPLFKMAHDPRVTRVGRILRRTSADELPQLINVLRGQMSIVGPRPLPVEESARLEGPALDRMHVVPGITGLWQVSGRSDLSYADLKHLDSVYVRSWSFMWDLRILCKTPASVLARRGAY